MDYVNVKGRQGGNLYYLPEDGHLYVRKSRQYGKSYLVCYNTVLKDDDPHIQECAARCTLDEAKGLCTRNATCHNHGNHEVEFKDLQSSNAMKSNCHYLATNFSFSVKKPPVKDIFLNEMARYV